MEEFRTRYLSQYTRYPQQTTAQPDPDTGIITVIPCLNEPSILDTLTSLWQCKRPRQPVEVLVVINHAEDAPDEVKAYNAETYQAVAEWAAAHQDQNLRFLPLWFGDLRPKLAGVGTARKVGMDEAVYRFYQINQPKGVITCLDADCQVAPNYLEAVAQHFRDHPRASGANIAFAHPLTASHPEAIIDFELYLRYYKNALYWSGFPYAYHTIGSAVAVPCEVYQKVGGMNKQKAGEDFYFIEKLIYQGHFTELNHTFVYPSSRQSLRVPFGTGQAVSDYVAEEPDQLQVFSPESFQALKAFMEALPTLYESPEFAAPAVMPAPISNYLEQQNWSYFLTESKRYAHTQTNFLKRFFHWFDAFKALQYLHTARDRFYPNVPVLEASQWLYRAFGYSGAAPATRQTMLEHWRWHDQQPAPPPNPLVPF